MKKIILLVSLAILGLFIVGCNHPAEPKKTTPPATYTVTFNANGGTGEMASQTFTTGVAQNLTANSFTVPAGKDVFSHWNTKKDGNGATYVDGKIVTATQNIKLYAIWANYTPESEFTEENGAITAYTGTDPFVHIPPSVNDISITSIGSGAFRINTKIISITIPHTVTSIGSSAFSGCTNLQNITIPNSVISIGNSALYGCSNLQNITIPNSVISIGSSAFDGCTNLQNITIPNTVTAIENYTFSRCTSLQSVSIPNSVKTIGVEAFALCHNLQSISIPHGVTSIAQATFSKCTALQKITIPNTVTSIGIGAFIECTNLQSITIPYSVTAIESGAFYGCSGLLSITIPNSVETIEGDAFEGCTELTTVYTNYTKDADSEKPYPKYSRDTETGWYAADNNNEKFFDAEWKPIPTS